jgi:hypothetical protein
MCPLLTAHVHIFHAQGFINFLLSAGFILMSGPTLLNVMIAIEDDQKFKIFTPD